MDDRAFAVLMGFLVAGAAVLFWREGGQQEAVIWGAGSLFLFFLAFAST